MVATFALSPGPASAQQTSSASPARTGWDLTATAGLLVHRPDIDAVGPYYGSWYGEPIGGVVIGRHLSRHLKIELDLSASGEGRQYIARSAIVPPLTQPVFFSSERTSAVREIGALATWQFFDNEWIHPFVQGGVTVDFERVRWTTYPNFAGDPRGPFGVRPPFDDESGTRASAGALAGTGAKIYVAERVFIRPEGRFVLNARGRHVAFRAGLGVDF